DEAQSNGTQTWAAGSLSETAIERIMHQQLRTVTEIINLQLEFLGKSGGYSEPQVRPELALGGGAAMAGRVSADAAPPALPDASKPEGRPAGQGSELKYALTEAQEQLWVLAQLGQGGFAPITIGLRGSLDLAALRMAFQKVVERHESLRTFFSRNGDFQ